MKNKTIMVLDTETVGLEGHVYDVGYCLTNKRGDILAERNWLVEENFTNAKRMMARSMRASILPTMLGCFRMATFA